MSTVQADQTKQTLRTEQVSAILQSEIQNMNSALLRILKCEIKAYYEILVDTALNKSCPEIVILHNYIQNSRTTTVSPENLERIATGLNTLLEAHREIIAYISPAILNLFREDSSLTRLDTYLHKASKLLHDTARWLETEQSLLFSDIPKEINEAETTQRIADQTKKLLTMHFPDGIIKLQPNFNTINKLLRYGVKNEVGLLQESLSTFQIAIDESFQLFNLDPQQLNEVCNLTQTDHEMETIPFIDSFSTAIVLLRNYKKQLNDLCASVPYSTQEKIDQNGAKSNLNRFIDDYLEAWGNREFTNLPQLNSKNIKELFGLLSSCRLVPEENRGNTRAIYRQCSVIKAELEKIDSLLRVFTSLNIPISPSLVAERNLSTLASSCQTIQEISDHMPDQATLLKELKDKKLIINISGATAALDTNRLKLKNHADLAITGPLSESLQSLVKHCSRLLADLIRSSTSLEAKDLYIIETEKYAGNFLQQLKTVMSFRLSIPEAYNKAKSKVSNYWDIFGAPDNHPVTLLTSWAAALHSGAWSFLAIADLITEASSLLNTGGFLLVMHSISMASYFTACAATQGLEIYKELAPQIFSELKSSAKEFINFKKNIKTISSLYGLDKKEFLKLSKVIRHNTAH